MTAPGTVAVKASNVNMRFQKAALRRVCPGFGLAGAGAGAVGASGEGAGVGGPCTAVFAAGEAGSSCAWPIATDASEETHTSNRAVFKKTNLNCRQSMLRL